MTQTPTTPHSVDLLVGGMTCASCVARVEKKLNRLEGVEATVNLATASAHVRFDPALVSESTLVETVERTGYTATLPSEDDDPVGDEAAHARALLRRLLLAAPLTVAVLVLAMAPGVPRLAWWQLALTLPVVAYAGWPFHRAAAVNARHLASTMDTLVSLGTLVAFTWSVVQLLDGQMHLYFEVAATVTTFLLVGRYLEARAKSRAGSALHALLELGAKRALVMEQTDDGVTEHEVDVAALRPGMRMLVRPGAQVPTDGVVVDGASALEESMVTGESLPREVTVGDEVVGGTLNTDGRLVVEVTRIGRDTLLARIRQSVVDAQTGKAPIQRLADRISAVFVPVVLVIALVTFAAWLLTGHPVEAAMTAAVSVLVIACPCALGLATPTALLVGTGRAAQLGIVIRGAEVLESSKAITTVVLDKTGTLTTGAMQVHETTGDPEAVALAAVLEAASEHPVARAIVSHARAGGRGATSQVTDFLNRPGAGVSGTVHGHRVEVGRAPEAADLDGELADGVRRGRDQGRTTILVRVDDVPRAVIAVGDTVKDSSRHTVEQLAGLGLHVVLLTGDHATAARHVAAEVGIDTVVAGVMPEDKVREVRRLQEAGEVVAMVGDGVNDAAALVQADLGIAIGTGTDAAIEAGDLTVVNGDPALVATSVRLARRTLSVIRQNLFWAFAYNLVGIPVAALGLLNPMLAGAAMAASSVCVVGNSLRLRRFGADPV